MDDNEDDKENAQPQQQQQMVSDLHSAAHRQPAFTRIGPAT